MSATPAHLADNVAHFGRALRSAGLRVGPADILAAIEATRIVGLDRRDDLRAALGATLLKRHEDRLVFDELFSLFWRSRRLNERLVAILSPRAPPRADDHRRRAGARRAEEARADRARPPAEPPRKLEIEADARATGSANDVLRHKDFALMSAGELATARRAIAALAMPDDEVSTRRLRTASRGGLDLRDTLRRAARTEGEPLRLKHRAPRRRLPPLVLVIDISGSMSRYSEMMLRFSYALAERRRSVFVFLFGTRLTNVTRALRGRDPDEALAACASEVRDWSGGTRIGEALARFNRDWSRRVLGQGANVLLVTDGLETGDTDELSSEAGRLARSCRRLVWLSPLLGFEGFAAKARGVRALLRQVDEFRPVHSVEAIAELCEALSVPRSMSHDPKRWLRAGDD